MNTNPREVRMVYSNIITAFIFGYIFAIIYLMCNGIIALITGNMTMLLTEFTTLRLDAIFLNFIRIISILSGILGVTISQIFIVHAIKNKKSIKRANTLVHILQFFTAIGIVTCVLFFYHAHSIALLSVTVSILICFITGCQVNNLENKIGDMTYQTMVFVGNIQQIANLLTEMLFNKFVSKTDYNYRDNTKKIGILIVILFIYGLGLYVGAKVALEFKFYGLVILPFLLLVPLIITYNRR